MSERSYDGILIPGGGLTADGSLPPWTVARLERALALAGEAAWVIPLSAGTVHKPPPLNPEGFPLYESRQASAFLANRGLDPGRILAETCSYDTIGNAYFARVLFADPLGLARMLVITSEFHLARVEAAFAWVFSLAPAGPGYQLSFAGTPDRGLEPAALAARQARERASLETLRAKIPRINTLEEFQRWLYREHAAYAVGGKSEELSGEELASY